MDCNMALQEIVHQISDRGIQNGAARICPEDQIARNLTVPTSVNEI